MPFFFVIALCFTSAFAARFDMGQSWALDVAAGTKGPTFGPEPVAVSTGRVGVDARPGTVAVYLLKKK